MFQNRLSKVYRHLGRQARRQGVSSYRVYDHDLPEYPLCIEFYEDKLYVAEYKRRHGMSEEEHDQWMEESLTIISNTLSVSKENIFLKLRQRKPGRLGQYQKFGSIKHEFTVSEGGHSFIVNLSDYLDTGLFLDHRITRGMVEKEVRNKVEVEAKVEVAVLNLFAYTGAFSVYAAAGGASKVITVDLSKTYLEWAKRNMQLNGFIDPVKYQFIHADVKQYLHELSPGSFGIIIMDPPTFSNSKRMDDILDIQKDHVFLVNQCIQLLQPGGSLYFSTNYRKFLLDKENIHTKSIQDITKPTTPFDFEGRFSRYCFRMERDEEV